MVRSIRMMFLAATALLTAPADAAGQETVDVELVLAVDVSLSMLGHELKIQRRGYAEAIVHPRVLEAIAQGAHQKIAVIYVEWAGVSSQRIVVPWTLIDGPDAAKEFSDRLAATPVSGMRRTSISGAIDHAASLFEDNGYRGLKRVIDISGDGPNNQGRAVTEARDEAVSRGIVINGLPLMTLNTSPFGSFDIDDLDEFYTHCVIGGPGSFMFPVDDWDMFSEAIRRKLIVELAHETGPLPVVQVSVEPAYDCLIGEKMWQFSR